MTQESPQEQTDVEFLRGLIGPMPIMIKEGMIVIQSASFKYVFIFR